MHHITYANIHSFRKILKLYFQNFLLPNIVVINYKYNVYKFLV
jgi:hypothetical protein